MVFIRDQPARLLIRISKQTNRQIPVSKIGKGIYLSSRSTVEAVTRFTAMNLVKIEKKGRLILTKITPKGQVLCKNLFELKENFGEGIICYEKK
jgi:DNA-binding MarR family transcriptional regulator